MGFALAQIGDQIPSFEIEAIAETCFVFFFKIEMCLGDLLFLEQTKMDFVSYQRVGVFHLNNRFVFGFS